MRRQSAAKERDAFVAYFACGGESSAQAGQGAVKVMFVPHGIDTDLFSPAMEKTTVRHPPTILFLANLQKRKGIFTY